MKKFLSIVLLGSILTGLTACGTPPGVAPESQTSSQAAQQSDDFSSDTNTDESLYSSEDIVSDTDTESDTNTDESDEDAIPSNASEYAVELYNKYKQLLQDSYSLSEITVEKGKYNYFSINYGQYENRFSIVDGETMFTVVINNKLSAIEQKKVIAIIFRALGEFSEDKANDLTQELANKYTGDNCSEPIKVGEYYVVLFPEDGFHLGSELRCVHTNEIWDDINPEEYPPVDRKMYESPELNIGENCQLTGTVIDWRVEEVVTDTYEGVAVLETEDGNQYDCTYLYDYNPVMFEIGTRYTIYGSIGRDLSYNGKISIDYPEKLN